MAVEQQQQAVVDQPQASAMQVNQTNTETTEQVQPKGFLSRNVMRLRGGDGHHPIAECCCFLCICIGIEDLCCIGIVDSCLGY